MGKMVNYQGVQLCLEKNIDILKEVDKRMNDSFMTHKDDLFFWIDIILIIKSLIHDMTYIPMFVFKFHYNSPMIKLNSFLLA
jgi:hypothetical protein